MYDLSIHGQVFQGRLAERWVYVKDGKIAKVSGRSLGSAQAELELSPSQFLFPAATDLHVHLRDWRQASKETVETGTKSAAAGGVTTVAEMPNTDPKLDTAERVEERVQLLRRKSLVDFAVHAGVPERLGELRRMKSAGAFAVKLFPPELVRFPEVLKSATAAGMLVAVHAEENSMVGTESAALAERAAVEKIIAESRTPSRVRFAHISTSEAATEIARARSTRRSITCEVTPHHLFMSDEVAEERIGITRKVNPSLRSAANSARMRRLLRRGVFDFYATDHAPHTVEEKFQGSPGFPALEIALPLLLSRVDDLGLVAKVYCEAPAKYLGLAKGKISPGYEADLVIVGRESWRVDPERFYSKGRVTPFAGEALRYSVDQVFKSGSSLYAGGRFTKTQTRLVSPGRRLKTT